MNRVTKLFAQIFCLLFFAVLVSVFVNIQQEKKLAKASEQPNFSEIKANIDQVKASIDPAATTAGNKIKNRFKLKSGLNKINKAEVWEGFTLYPVSGPEVIYLLNLDGKVVHQWNNIDADRARLLSNGNLLVLHGSKNLIKTAPWDKLRNRVSEYDWDGNLVWSYTSDYVIHHDMQRLPNGNTILLLKVPVTKEYIAKVNDPLRKTVELKSDSIIEINKSGKIVYRWNAWEHIDINECGVRECPGEHTLERKGNFDPDDYKDWTHLNTISIIPENKWFDAGDKRFKPGNFIIMPRNFWTIYIVDREGGEIVWEYTGDYKGGIVGGHDATMIEKGFPGAGNIIVLDNGSQNERKSASFILEINPKNKRLEWVYDVGNKFFTRARGAVQRLANGNTLISEDRNGRVLEVNPKKEIVWEYKGNLLIMRAKRYASDYSEKLQALDLYS